MDVVHHNARKPFPVPESVNDVAELFVRAVIERRLDKFPEAFSQSFGSPAQIGPQSALFRAHLVSGDNKRHQTDAEYEKYDQP
jgi:hypothetical protein